MPMMASCIMPASLSVLVLTWISMPCGDILVPPVMEWDPRPQLANAALVPAQEYLLKFLLRKLLALLVWVGVFRALALVVRDWAVALNALVPAEKYGI